jgi:hypothetical protein
MSTKRETMRHKQRARRCARGSALLLALICAFVLLVLVLGFIQLVTTGTRNTENLVHRRQALLLAQAGIAEALQEFYARQDLSGDGQVGSVGLEQWGPQESLQVTCTEAAPGSYLLVATGTVDLSDGASDNPGLRVSRTLQALVARYQGANGLFPGGLFSSDDLTISSGATVDSWDYTTKKIGPINGNIGSNGDILVSGGSTIQGDATPGPKGVVRISGADTVVTGSTTPRTLQLSPYKPLYNPPPVVDSLPVNLDGLAADASIPAGTYRISAWRQTGGTVTFRAPGRTVLYIDGNYEQSSGAAAVVEKGASVVIYSGTGVLQISGGGAAGAIGSDTGKYRSSGGADTNVGSDRPNDFQFISCAPSDSTVRLSEASLFCGTVYAPLANVSISGGAIVFGAVLGRAVRCRRGGKVHADVGTYMPFDPNADVELKYCREIFP